MSPSDLAPRRILLTGATGYVGGRLLAQLVRRGECVRCVARNPAHLSHWIGSGVEVVGGDVTDRASLDAACARVDSAYYLVHAMGDGAGFEDREREGARHFAAAAQAAGVRRIVYLGGLGEDRADLSPHLRSRQEVGRILRESGVPTIELRASIVVGSGSLSFEMIRALTEHLPVMVTPRWVSVLAQPIAIQDLIAYLLEALDLPLPQSVVVEIGGADQLSYAAMMREYARQRGLRRAIVRVPLLTPRLSSLWLGLVTPLYARVGRTLIESIRHPTVVTTDTARRLFTVRPVGAAEAIRAALENEDRAYAETRWSGAMSAAGGRRRPSTSDPLPQRLGSDPLPQGPGSDPGAPGAGARDPGPRAAGPAGHRLMDRREMEVHASPHQCFEAIATMGGRNGWPYGPLWRLRGYIDLLLGGVGMRRGRPDGRTLRVGDPLDFWRVEACTPDARLRLAAEMKVPGRAWLEFTVSPRGRHSLISQTATFDPAGLAGLAYWYMLVPVHAVVFRGMLKAIARRAMACRG